eukprot:g19358.t1
MEVKNYADKVVKQIDDFLESVVFKKIPQAKQLVAKLPPPVKPAYVVLGVGGLLVLLILFGFGMNAFSNLVGFVYPMWMSFKALRSANKDDDAQWLTYWIVYGFFTTVESLTDLLMSWIPFYYLIKIGFLIWLMAPQTQGAIMLFKKVIEPNLGKVESKVDAVLKKGGEGMSSAAAAVQRSMKEDEED